MSINDFEYSTPIEEEEVGGEEITSESGIIVTKYLDTKIALDTATSDALNASYDFGYAMGLMDKKIQIIELLESNGLTGAAKLIREG